MAKVGQDNEVGPFTLQYGVAATEKVGQETEVGDFALQYGVAVPEKVGQDNEVGDFELSYIAVPSAARTRESSFFAVEYDTITPAAAEHVPLPPGPSAGTEKQIRNINIGSPVVRTRPERDFTRDFE